MAIVLRDIYEAVDTYLESKVTVAISALRPAGGTNIDPNEKFYFDVSISNANATNKGCKLGDVVWRIWVDNGSVGKLKVPPTTTAVAKSALSGGTTLTAGSYVGEMYLFPPAGTDKRILDVGETDSLSLEGQAGSSPSGGTTNIRFQIKATVDMNWLFSQDEWQTSNRATRTLPVVG
jgi:hypothetical protein